MAPASAADAKPNMVFIFADDWGGGSTKQFYQYAAANGILK